MKANIILGGILALGATAHGEFQLIDNFDGLIAGPLGTQNSWVSDAVFTVDPDPSGGTNQVLKYVFGVQGGAYRSLQTAIENGESATLFYRFRFITNANANTGFSDVATPAVYADFEAQVNRQNTTPIKGRDGAAFQDLSTAERVILADTPDIWYSIWLVADNGTDTSRVFIQSNDDPDFVTQTEVFTPDGIMNFRNGTASPLISLMLRAQEGTAFWDDFYIAPGLDLSNPVPPPAPTEGLQITGFRYGGEASLELNWTSVNGHQYAVERSSNLKDWERLSDLVTADSEATTAELFDDDIAPVNGRLYFRIQDLGVPAP